MKRKTAGRVSRPRMCAFCSAPIAERRPVYLLATEKGQIVGPYHAGCAERIVISNNEVRSRGLETGIVYGRAIKPGREETLPW